MGADLTGRTFAIWGLAFKPNTDDMREAPSRILIAALLARGARVQVYDPVAMEEARRALALDLSAEQLERVTFCAGQMDALRNADALVIVTEWKAFRSPDFQAVKALLKTPMVFDGRNLFEPQAMHEAGFEYQAIGRSTQS
jgi:UDPglucose 6-dehydrogenase